MSGLPDLTNIGGSLPDLGDITPKQPVFDSKLIDYDWGTPSIVADDFLDDFNGSGWVGHTNLDMILSEAIEAGASDIHITPEQQIAFTINGDIVFQPQYSIPDGLRTMNGLANGVLNNEQYALYAPERDYDFAYKIKHGPYEGRRFRGNIGRSFGMDFLVFRTISDEIPSLSALGVDDEIIDWSMLTSGMWMICGSTGTGKSTTLASVIRNIQIKKSKKIITIEKPIEYQYPADGLSLILQREVGIDTLSFANGLTAAMRENPDIVLIGEVRNKEEVEALVQAADSGHLAISTMHTNSVATTINRIQALFEGSERARILSTLGDSLRGLGNQLLVKDKRGSRFAVRELLTFDKETRKLVAKGDVEGIRQYQLDHKITMEDKLVQLVKNRKVTLEEAYSHVAYPDDFREIYRRVMGKNLPRSIR